MSYNFKTNGGFVPASSDYVKNKSNVQGKSLTEALDRLAASTQPEELSFTLGRNGAAANNIFLTLPGNVSGSTGRGIAVPAGASITKILYRAQRAGADPVEYQIQGPDNTPFFSFTVPAGENNYAQDVSVPVPNSPDPGSTTGSFKIFIPPFVTTGLRARGISVSVIVEQAP